MSEQIDYTDEIAIKTYGKEILQKLIDDPSTPLSTDETDFIQKYGSLLGIPASAASTIASGDVNEDNRVLNFIDNQLQFIEDTKDYINSPLMEFDELPDYDAKYGQYFDEKGQLLAEHRNEFLDQVNKNTALVQEHFSEMNKQAEEKMARFLDNAYERQEARVDDVIDIADSFAQASEDMSLFKDPIEKPQAIFGEQTMGDRESQLDQVADKGKELLNTTSSSSSLNFQIQNVQEIAKKNEAQRLLETAQAAAEDPSMAQRLLRIANNMLSPADVSTIKNNIPLPGGVRQYNLTAIPIPAEAFSISAYNVMRTNSFLTSLESLDQEVDVQYQNLINRVQQQQYDISLDDDSKRRIFDQIEEIRGKTWQNHYDIVRKCVELFLYAEICDDFYQNINFTRFKAKISHALLQYNCHNPKHFLGTEESMLRQIGVIRGYIHDLREYLSSEEFKRLQAKYLVSEFDRAKQEIEDNARFLANERTILDTEYDRKIQALEGQKVELLKNLTWQNEDLIAQIQKLETQKQEFETQLNTELTSIDNQIKLYNRKVSHEFDDQISKYQIQIDQIDEDRIRLRDQFMNDKLEIDKLIDDLKSQQKDELDDQIAALKSKQESFEKPLRDAYNARQKQFEADQKANIAKIQTEKKRKQKEMTAHSNELSTMKTSFTSKAQAKQNQISSLTNNFRGMIKSSSKRASVKSNQVAAQLASEKNTLSKMNQNYESQKKSLESSISTINAKVRRLNSEEEKMLQQSSQQKIKIKRDFDLELQNHPEIRKITDEINVLTKSFNDKLEKIPEYIELQQKISEIKTTFSDKANSLQKETGRLQNLISNLEKEKLLKAEEIEAQYNILNRQKDQTEKTFLDKIRTLEVEIKKLNTRSGSDTTALDAQLVDLDQQLTHWIEERKIKDAEYDHQQEELDDKLQAIYQEQSIVGREFGSSSVNAVKVFALKKRDKNNRLRINNTRINTKKRSQYNYLVGAIRNLGRNSSETINNQEQHLVASITASKFKQDFSALDGKINSNKKKDRKSGTEKFNNLIEQYKKDIQDILDAIANKKKEIKKLNTTITTQGETIKSNESSITSKDITIRDKEKTIKDKDRLIASNNKEIARIITERTNLQKQVEKLKNEIKTANLKIKELNEFIENQRVSLQNEIYEELSRQNFDVGEDEVESAIDLDNIENPIAVLNQFELDLISLINNGFSQIGTAKLLGNDISFNIYTNTFGSSVDLVTNLKVIEDMRRDLQEHFKGDFGQAEILTPKLFLHQDLEMSCFPLEIGRGDALYTKSISPDSSVELRFRSSYNTKESRQKAQTVVDSSSSASKEAFQSKLESQQASNNATVDTDERHFEKSQQQKQEQRKDASVSVSASVGYGPASVSAGASASKSDSRSNSNDASQGGSNMCAETNSESASLMEAALSDSVSEASESREMSVSDNTDTSIEETREETQVITIKNPNQYSSMNLIYYPIVQTFLSTIRVTDIRLRFIGGSDTSFPLSHLAAFLDEYIKDEFKDYRDIVLNWVISACNVVDYKNRVINAVEQNPFLRFKKDCYITQLRRGYPLDPEDLLMERFNEYLSGVVISRKIISLLKEGIIEEATIGGLAVDRVNLAQITADQREQELKNLHSETQVRVLEDYREFLKNLNSVDELAKFKAEQYWKLIKEPNELFNTKMLIHALAGEKSESKENDFIRKLKLVP